MRETSLLAQWQSNCLAMQGTWVRSVVRELISHKRQGNEAHVPQLLSPRPQLECMHHSKRPARHKEDAINQPKEIQWKTRAWLKKEDGENQTWDTRSPRGGRSIGPSE